MTSTLPRTDWHEAMTVTVPEGQSGDVRIARFEVSADEASIHRIRSGGRAVRSGTYTGLYRSGYLWMSDTPAEKRDHLTFVHEAAYRDARRAVINGLGLGVVVSALLCVETIEHIDVVEIDADVIALVGPHYERLAAEAGKTITVHHADAYTIQWPVGTTWDVAWHDIWRDLCTDNLPQMAKLHRRYGRRVQWQGSWARDLLEYHRDRERRRGW
jgi:hypothetical protein